MGDSISTFIVNSDSRLQYTGLYVLKEMEEEQHIFTPDLEDDELVLEPVLNWLREMGYIYLDDTREYKLSHRGKEHVHSFLNRYAAFIEEFDIFCGVDLKSLEFAVSHYHKFQDSLDWYAFLEDERWLDLRVAVAEFKGLDAIEIVFMSFIHENRFGRNTHGWCYEHLLGSIWDEIQTVCNNSVRLKSMSCDLDGQRIPGEQIMVKLLQLCEQ
ncbi:MAG: hypothetical protein HYW48_01250 [Deltaproteobacteria bacterium]|nr:hypothetical protein [Deltaproteobacteria bacterium]